jgi:hypothetical protein
MMDEISKGEHPIFTHLTVFFGGIIIAGGIAWFGLGRDVMTRSEGQDLIKQSVEDTARKQIEANEKVNAMDENVKNLSGDVRELKATFEERTRVMEAQQKELKELIRENK